MTGLDILTRIHEMPAVDTKLVAGRWHHDRATFKGIVLEARVLCKSLIVRRHRNRRFLIIGRARSGTTLLTRLLNGHSAIRCDGEVLKRYMLSPKLYLDRLAGKSDAAAYGAKLLSYQMVQVHRMRAPQRFLAALAEQGVTLIHLERETFAQTLSLEVAKSRRQFHSDKGAQAPSSRLEIDPQHFLQCLLWNEALLAYERAALAELDHMHLIYETDLADPEAQAATLNRICAGLDLPYEAVEVPLKKVLPTEPDNILLNYDAIREVVAAAGCEHLLPSQSGANHQEPRHDSPL